MGEKTKGVKSYRVGFRIDQSMYDKLHTLAENKGIHPSTLVRNMIDAYLKKEKVAQ